MMRSGAAPWQLACKPAGVTDPCTSTRYEAAITYWELCAYQSNLVGP